MPKARKKPAKNAAKRSRSRARKPATPRPIDVLDAYIAAVEAVPIDERLAMCRHIEALPKLKPERRFAIYELTAGI